MKFSSVRLILTGIVLESLYVGFYLIEARENEVLWLLTLHVGVVAGLLFWLKLFFYDNTRVILELSSRDSLTIIIGFGILFRVTLFPHDIVGSDDIFRYVWDGRVTLSGENPFRYAPVDSALQGLATDELPARINHPEMRTIYPPLAQLSFAFSNFVFGPSVAGLKFLFVLCDIATMVLLLRLLKLVKRAEGNIILYAWSPLPVLYVGLDGHVDALGIPFLLTFLLLVLQGKHVRGALALGLAALAKLYPLMVAPFLYRKGDFLRSLLVVMIPALLLFIGLSFYLEPSGGLYESFIVFNTSFEFNGSIFKILLAFLGSNQLAHVVSGLLFILSLVILFFVNRPILEKVVLAFLAFILFAPSVQPWYLLWLNALIVLRWSRAIYVLLGTVGLSNLVVFEYVQSGVWQDQSWILLIEYIPFFILLLIDYRSRRLQP